MTLESITAYYIVSGFLVLCIFGPMLAQEASDAISKREFDGEDADAQSRANAASVNGGMLMDWPKSADYPHTRRGTNDYLRCADAAQDARIERETGSPPDWSNEGGVSLTAAA